MTELERIRLHRLEKKVEELGLCLLLVLLFAGGSFLWLVSVALKP